MVPFHTLTKQLSAEVSSFNFNGFAFKQELAACRYGQDFATQTARKYFKKVKNAQEAHEAIRPTDIRRLPCNQIYIVMHVVFNIFWFDYVNQLLNTLSMM